MFSLNQSYVFTLLNVTHGLNTLISENPLCFKPSSINNVNCFKSVEKDCATKVAPADIAISSGESVVSIEPSGVDFVLKPSALRGDV
ncbi:hypothetical protein D3C87_1859120 [compost metagenome]